MHAVFGFWSLSFSRSPLSIWHRELTKLPEFRRQLQSRLTLRVVAAKYSNSFSPAIPIRKWNLNPTNIPLTRHEIRLLYYFIVIGSHPQSIKTGSQKTGILMRSSNKVPAFFWNERNIAHELELFVDPDLVCWIKMLFLCHVFNLNN